MKAEFFISIVLILGLVFFIPWGNTGQQLLTLPPHMIAGAGLLMLLHLVFSSARFWHLHKKFKITLPAFTIHKINIYSLIYSLLLIPSLSQIVGRVNHSRAHTKQGHLYVSITFLEKAVSAAALLLLVLLSFMLQHQSLSISGAVFSYIAVVSFAVMFIAVVIFFKLLDEEDRTSIKQACQEIIRLDIPTTLLFSILMHVSTLAAFLYLGTYFFPETSWYILISAFLLIMLASAIPISFAGWGVRELSAVLIFAQLGLNFSSAALLAAIIGLLYLAALGIHFALVYFVPSPKQQNRDKPVTASVPVLKTHFLLLGAVCLGILFPFQFHLPTNTKSLNIHLSDPIALLMGFTFLSYWLLQKPREILWQHRYFGFALFSVILMLFFGWGNGWIQYGSNDWAGVNRIMGLILIASYLMTGIVIGLNFSWQKIQQFIRLLAIVVIIGIVIQFIIFPFIVLSANEDFSHNFIAFFVWEWSVTGFFLDRNAFALFVSMLLCFLLFQQKRYQWYSAENWLSAALIIAVILSNSRIGYLGLLTLFLFYGLRHHLCFKKLFFHTAICFAIAETFKKIPQYIKSLSTSLEIIFNKWGIDISLHSIEFVYNMRTVFHVRNLYDMTSINTRIEEWLFGFQMWQENLWFGAGLGAFIEQKNIVLHNVPLWILAEMGIVGLLLFLPLPLVIAHHIFKHGWRKMSDERIILLAAMLVFGLLSMAHDILYQRIVWLILGLLMCHKASGAADKRKTQSVII